MENRSSSHPPSRSGHPSTSRGGQERTGGRREFVRRRRVCKFCVEKIDYVDWKDYRTLLQFVPERGKVMPRRLSGVCARHQRRLVEAIKKARNIALLPFAGE